MVAGRPTGGYDDANDRLRQLFCKNPKISSVSIQLGLFSGSPSFTVQLQLKHVMSATDLTES
jgi:hypothetical protein